MVGVELHNYRALGPEPAWSEAWFFQRQKKGKANTQDTPVASMGSSAREKGSRTPSLVGFETVRLAQVA